MPRQVAGTRQVTERGLRGSCSRSGVGPQSLAHGVAFRAVWSLAVLFVLVLVAGRLHAEPAKPATSPAPAAEEHQLQRPDVGLEIIADRDAIEVGAPVPVTLIVTNKSDIPLADVKVAVHSDAFRRLSGSLPVSLAPFGTAIGNLVLKPGRDDPDKDKTPVIYGTHKVPVIVEYAWTTPKGDVVTSAQTGSVTLNVLRRFDEEGKSLPGGSAAFLYLLLPVIPAFFAYSVVDQLRQGKGLEMPKFGTEQIVPAFLLSLVLSGCAVGFDVDLAYYDRQKFIFFMIASAFLGALLPLVQWAREANGRRRWTFHEQDSYEDYLRKALFSPKTRNAKPVWVEGTVDSVVWAGMRLFQPDGAPVLGAQLQVSPNPDEGEGRRKELWDKLERILSGNELKEPELLLEMIRTRQLVVNLLDAVKRGEEAITDVVSTDKELLRLQPKSLVDKTLVKATR